MDDSPEIRAAILAALESRSLTPASIAELPAFAAMNRATIDNLLNSMRYAGSLKLLFVRTEEEDGRTRTEVHYALRARSVPPTTPSTTT
ncbi:MAG: hypothetical protein KGM43_13070 [Planctomycetota bacterium]|nr:hypothetical protein [Planctomycetota bacterium]